MKVDLGVLFHRPVVNRADKIDSEVEKSIQ